MASTAQRSWGDPWDLDRITARDRVEQQHMMNRMYHEMRENLTREVEDRINMRHRYDNNSDQWVQAETMNKKLEQKKVEKVVEPTKEDKKLKDLISYYYSRNR